MIEKYKLARAQKLFKIELMQTSNPDECAREIKFLLTEEVKTKTKTKTKSTAGRAKEFAVRYELLGSGKESREQAEALFNQCWASSHLRLAFINRELMKDNPDFKNRMDDNLSRVDQILGTQNSDKIFRQEHEASAGAVQRVLVSLLKAKKKAAEEKNIRSTIDEIKRLLPTNKRPDGAEPDDH